MRCELDVAGRRPKVPKNAKLEAYGNVKEAHMCLSIAFAYDGNEHKEIMRDVARIEAEQQGFWLVDFFGKEIFVEATIQSIDFVDGHFVALKFRERSPATMERKASATTSTPEAVAGFTYE